MDDQVDVAVVGAGYSGLTAAWRVHQAGRSVAVLEARDRIGGRVWTETRPDGLWIDRGGAWLGPGQDRLYALAAELGVATYNQHVAGDILFELDGQVTRYRGLIPKGLGPVALASLGAAFARIDRLARTVPIDAPWTAPAAERLDAISCEAWLRRWRNVPSETARRLLRMTVQNLFGSAPAEVSLLNFLFHVHAAGGMTFQTSVENGAEHDRLTGGMAAPLKRIRERLGRGAVRLSAPVRAIAQDASGVTLRADGTTIRARRAIVATPPALGAHIQYTPALPADRAMLLHRVPAGYVVKITLLYEEPFWRADGLSGEAIAVGSPVTLVIDGCTPSPPPGILHAFLAGPEAQRWARRPSGDRRAIVLVALQNRFGPRAASPVEYLEHVWADEVWSRGGYMAHYPPGVLTAFRATLREPVGRLHFAGTETATRSNGFIDGAVRAGERAAEEVLAGLEDAAPHADVAAARVATS